MDFTFNNTNIKAFFDTGENPPVSEFLYLHSHPLVRPNFILQLEDQILRLNDRALQGKNVSTRVIDELVAISIEIGSKVTSIYKEETAKEILSAFRRSYLLCNSLGILIKPV